MKQNTGSYRSPIWFGNVVTFLMGVMLVLSGCTGIGGLFSGKVDLKIEPIDLGGETLQRVDDFNKRIEELNTIIAGLGPAAKSIADSVNETNRTINSFNRDFKLVDQATLARLDAAIAKTDPILRQLEFGIGLNQETRGTVEKLISSLDKAPDKWEDTLSKVIQVLDASGTDMSASIAKDLRDVLKDTSDEAKQVAEYMGEETRCTVDQAKRTADTFVGQSIEDVTKLKLFGAITLLSTGQKLNQLPSQPWICHVRPDAVELLLDANGKRLPAESLIRIVGFNFITDTLPSLAVDFGDGHVEDISTHIHRESSYRILVNLQGYDFSAAASSPKLVFNWPQFGKTEIPLIYANAVPIANAGDDQPSVTDTNNDGAELVNLDGSKSQDPDGTIAEYIWMMDGAKEATGENPQVLLPVGTHLLVLTITDDRGATDQDEVAVTVNAFEGKTPIAQAGSDGEFLDANHDGSESVNLDARGSTDLDNDISKYEWRENGQLLAEGPTPTISLPVGTHAIELTVTDSAGHMATDSVVVIVHEDPNKRPIANAGQDGVFLDGDNDGSEIVQLDGSASYDLDGIIVEYAWYDKNNGLLSKGSQPQVTLGVGVHTVELQVQDDKGLIGADTVVVDIQSPTPTPAPPPTPAFTSYTIVVQTNCGEDSGTDGDFLIRLIGDANSAEYYLDKPGYEDQETCGRDEYTFSIPTLGNVQYIEVEIRSGKEPSEDDWWSDWISVTNNTSGVQYMFDCDEWLGNDSDGWRVRIPAGGYCSYY